MKYFQWIEYPRAGTQVLDGRWLCTIQNSSPQRKPLEVMFCELEDGEWFVSETGGELWRGAKVIAIAHTPEPYRPPSSMAGVASEAHRHQQMRLPKTLRA